MADELLYNVGIDDLFIAMMTAEDTISTTPTYDTKIWRLPIIVKLGIKGNGNTSTKYASNKIFRKVSKEDSHELSLDHVAMPIELLDKMKGLASTNGVSFNKGGAKTMPFFAVGFIAPQSDGKMSATWYPKAQLAIETESEYETQTEEPEIKDIAMTINTQSLIYNDVLNSHYNAGRLDAVNISANEFMSQVIYDESQIAALAATAE
ncbi:major tail protein [Macrococcoides bohemicum]|uniref:Phage tail protein n=1 Tax=Macrococcoides bohemicum TaxID=1903056 RepID=A0A328A6S6_9STAP|nr:major tail protein [Macrococcus bohemicus]RAK50201.1 phage tail protein [Macrococcus bohemicus]